MYLGSFNAFHEIDSHDFEQHRLNEIDREIEQNTKEYILGVNELDFIKYLEDKFCLEKIEVNIDNPSILPPKVSKERQSDRFYGERLSEVYIFTIEYSFTGTPELLKVKPSTWAMTTTEITLTHNSKVTIKFKHYNKDPNDFKRNLNEYESRAFTNIRNINNFVDSWNSQLKNIITNKFSKYKQQILHENNFFEAINVKVNPKTANVFSVPTLVKKTIPKPSSNENKKYTLEPSMDSETYRDVLNIIYQTGKNMEKKPSLYKDKDEEALRDQILLFLETRYENVTATGETFNRGGKTDILLKYATDGSNLFIAECKFWHGKEELFNAISQLFDRYLTWRDSKVALIFFVKNKNFSNVIDICKTEIKNHEYYLKELGKSGESSFSYVFHLPNDEDREVYLEVMLFHYDKG